VQDSSPGGLEYKSTPAFEGGIDYSYKFKSGFGIGGSFNMGYITFGYKFRNPDNVKIIEGYLAPNYLYNTLALNSSYSFKFRNLNVRAFVSPGVRRYPQASILIDATNNSASYSKGPGSGSLAPPVSAIGNDYLQMYFDQLNRRVQYDISSGISIERQFSERTGLLFGIRKHWGVEPINFGDVVIRANNQLYKGSYNLFSNYTGIDLAFKYSFPKKESEPKHNLVSTFTNSRKSIYGEVAGNGPGISLNYDRRFKTDRNGGLGYRVGIGWAGDGTASFPLAINHLLGNGRNALETGIGITPIVRYDKDPYQSLIDGVGVLNVGYRFQPLRDGLLFRLTWAPAFDTKRFYPLWAGASVGYTFK
jgi:hypothetical protein